MLFFSHPGRVTDDNICVPVSDITADEETKAESKSWDHPAGGWIRGEHGKETIQHAVLIGHIASLMLPTQALI